MAVSPSGDPQSQLRGTELKIYATVRKELLRAGLTDPRVKTYSLFAVEIYRYTKAHPELKQAFDGIRSTKDFGDKAKEAQAAFAQADRAANVMSSEVAAARFASKGTASAGGALTAFVDYFASLAKILGIEMNECALSITKVILDALTIVAMLDTGLGALFMASQLLSTASDARSMANACYGS